MPTPQDREIARQLRRLAAKYFNHELIPAQCNEGICKAMWVVGRVEGDEKMSHAFFHQLHGLNLLTYGYGDRYLAPPGTCWEDRAMFCLVYAEYLENVKC